MSTRRIKLALAALMISVFAVTHLVPGVAAFAGPMGGGSGICGNC